MQGTLHPGVLPRLLGELYLRGESGLLRLIKQDKRLECGLSEGRIVFARRGDLHGREALFDALAWDEGSYSFKEQPVAPAQPDAFADLTMPDVIREAVQRIEDPDVVSRVLGGVDRVLLRTGSAPASMPLTPAEDVVLSRVDGVRSAREIIGLVPFDAEDTQRTLVGLICAGVLEARSAPEGQHNEVEPEHAESWRQNEPVPVTADRVPPPVTYTEIVGAPELDAPEDLVENALYADDAIRKASHLIAESDYWGAIRLLDAVIPQIQPKKFKQEAQVLLARAYAKNPKWVRRAEELLQAIVHEDPACVHAYFVLGTIYKANGLTTRALGMFRKVLQLQPNHHLAAAEIAGPNAHSLHGKLFGRT